MPTRPRPGNVVRPASTHQIRADLLRHLSGEYRLSAGKGTRRTGSFPGRWGKTSAVWRLWTQKLNTAALGSRHTGTQGLSRSVVSSASHQLVFLSSPTRGNARSDCGRAWSSSPRHNVPLCVVHAGHTVQLLCRSALGMGFVLASYTVTSACCLGTASPTGTNGTATTIRGTAQHNQVLSGSVQVGRDRADRRFVVLAAGIRFRIPLQHEVTTIP